MSEWQKVKIGDFLKRIKRPVTLEDDKEYKLVTIQLHHKGVKLRGRKKGNEIKSTMHEVKVGDFILSGIDARNGAFGIVGDELDGAIVTNDFWYFELNEELIDKHFFLELTSTKWFDEICRLGSDGTTQRIRLQKTKFFDQEIYLPSVDKQKEVSKRFISIKRKKEQLKNECSSQQSVLTLLRQQILQDAISGKLTADWRLENPNAEPASKLLEQIKAEKEKLMVEKKIKKEKALPLISEDEVPFDLPEGWEWCRLGDFCLNKDGERIPVSQSERLRREKIFDYYGASGVIDKIDGFTHEGKHLLVGEDGANLVARSTPVAFVADGKFWVNNHAHVLKFFAECSLNYCEIFINGISLKPYLTGGFQPKLSQRNLNQIKIAVPPRAEQRAIVAKVERLMMYVSQLEGKTAQNANSAETLIQAFLSEVFSN